MNYHKGPADWLQSQGFSGDYTLTPLAGGDINETALLRSAEGRQFCIKQNPGAPADFFQAEAAGLIALANSRTLRVPEMLHVARGFIILEYIEAGRRKPRYWRALGEGLAVMHRQKQTQFGFPEDNYCGLTPQRNTFSKDGYDFFREQRILFQAELAFGKGLLNKREVRIIETVAGKLERLIPFQEPALLHGDLWGGNIHTDSSGEPVLIDPAAYYGWPEADLAMTTLFGGFSDEFYASYLSVNPLESGWRERLPLYNLYHLLNHLNLFGGGYHSQVMAVAQRFGHR